jgi:hypothetical protein
MSGSKSGISIIAPRKRESFMNRPCEILWGDFQVRARR